MRIKFYITLIFSLLSISLWGQRSTLTREYITPERIVLESGNITNSERLLKDGIGQSTLSNADVCVIKGKGSILVDFGCELHGAIEIVTGMSPTSGDAKLHITLGESVGEAMSRIGEKGATNDHAVRDFDLSVPWLGVVQYGNSGFRFARIETLDSTATLYLREVRAISIYKDVPQLGTFESSDRLLNQIWSTGKRTVHLCMQDYLWDGIKRDRLVWIGDMMPEVISIFALFGADEIIPKSLDLTRDATPLPGWMNGISSYSLWWVLLQEEWYKRVEDFDYLKEQEDYLYALLEQIIKTIDDNGVEHLGGTRFLDWPSNANSKAIDAGLQSLTVMTMKSGEHLCKILGNKELSKKCKDYYKKTLKAAKTLGDEFIKTNQNPIGEKQAVALLTLCGALDAAKGAELIAKNGTKGFSTFYGYFMCEALAMGGMIDQATDIIKEYWGGMLKMGATTFWEDFDLAWMDGSAPIDEVVPEGKKDIHGDFGAYCYLGFRHSLCHGWASGPTPWMMHHILGITLEESGYKEISINPHLGKLDWAKGSYPTPYGIISVSLTKDKEGKTIVDVDAPKEIKININK